MDIRNKTIIITGASRIGRKIAEDLKNKGANLVITYLRDIEGLDAFGFVVKADVSKKRDVDQVVKKAKEKFGRINYLIHLAAIYEKSEWNELDEKTWDRNMNIIAKSAFLFGKAAGDEMLKNEGELKGKIIFFSDWSVLTRPYKDHLVYNTAKSAILGLTKSFARELAPHILVNAIAPGPILKPANLTEEENKEVISNTLLRKWGGAEEISKGVQYLLEADFVTGQTLTIDGGRTIA